MTLSQFSSKARLLGLNASHFRHPLDQRATEALKQIPGIDIAIRSLLGPMGEQFFYLENIAASVLVGPKQLPDIYQLLVEACQILDLDVPQLYIKQHPVPNAYTFAMRGRQPFIVVHTSLVELLNPAELQAVIGHELGHLKCDHGVYLTLANLLTLATSQLPFGAVLVQNWQSRIMEWVRCAEFTCDRAALLATQDARTVAAVLMKLSGGSPTLSPQLNLDAFLAQAESYDAISDNEMGELLKRMKTDELSHPVPVLRAREINRWATTPNYQSLLENRPTLKRRSQAGQSTHKTSGKTNSEERPTGSWINW
ncbi:M48 family metallopeptidase [cf. Phormidesmis sp. LEGE 11477]|uniref:M48 family metallopeptidase n=1 Tax=cf. Phormidesmis sp. LEGE 11477 TaxID=1828680 RepID=UPI00187FC2AC|nr:M48 family metallopeptidase [cf. Phormidesmis sp. LEGE 11477]MBE9060545.1 M48 family metallopeptidase [cf. Phormidesmis sp. LEGE 11477]